MNRSAFFVTHTLPLIGAVLLTLALAGCGTLRHPMPDDAQTGFVPSGRGAP